jgi:hypothetical protein
MSSQDQQGRASKRRAALLGAVLLAAGSMLWLSLRSAAVPEVIADPAIQAPSEDLFPHSFVTETNTPAAVAQLPPSLDGFNVSVRLLNESTDAQVLSRVRDYYEALINGLRAVPGLHLVEDHAVLQGGNQPEFRLTVSIPDLPNEQQARSSHPEWVANVSVEVLNGDAAGTVYGLGMIGDAWKGGAPAGVYTRGPLSGDCATRTPMPCTAVDIAERHVMAVRKHVFPRDGSLERELEARFLDAAQPERERQQLRNDLKSMKMALSDSMIREALARLARPVDTSSAYSQNERYDLLIILAGQRHKELVQPLIDLALYDSDVSFRIETVKLLAADFPENIAARNVLEKLALNPSYPELQMTAVAMLSRISGK